MKNYQKENIGEVENFRKTEKVVKINDSINMARAHKDNVEYKKIRYDTTYVN